MSIEAIDDFAASVGSVGGARRESRFCASVDFPEFVGPLELGVHRKTYPTATTITGIGAMDKWSKPKINYVRCFLILGFTSSSSSGTASSSSSSEPSDGLPPSSSDSASKSSSSAVSNGSLFTYHLRRPRRRPRQLFHRHQEARQPP